MVAGLKGILPVLPTPFLADGGIDEAGMKRLVVFALDKGVDGVVFPGFASEVETLNAAERATLLKIVVDAVAGRVPVVAGASAADWRDVVEHGRAASALGIRHLMVQPPKSVGTDAPALIEFLGKVVEALPEVEIILQNAPAPRGSDLSPQAIVEIVRALPQVTYVKEETLPAGPAISHIIAHAPSTLKGVIGGGGARYILDEYARGATAAMPALEIAEEHVAIDRALVAGRQEEARRIYVRTLPLLVLQAVYRMRLTKYVLARRGVIEGVGVRAPTPELDAAAIADIDANLVELGLVAAEAA
ncbi:dihydrodipicolinate synthase family protein [Agrobacterium genomosp. 3]|uniref:Dihydrodipicolinate synthase family protein n=1 Tax=Agrobacterium tumefaciens TaxID=358 RepID=A0AAE6BQR8_AGRTU|nr:MULTISPECIES: dihydrodipicolinate synthase family protein [Agrobacterium]MBP8939547.1 dihydrodipicolinate synthase family protein [Agrobacterium sp.]MCA1867825.1 dihydrodipicolinate synthase family protein [Agrobacterium tomkonis]MCA2377299.1 dihydrodipicolinate synthase family protein [Agrobacterium tomkonis RTP8]KNY32544.1 dihydrodipicolinate synthase [Agrobacterium sp. SUL3]MCA1878263.1 dihydrodipicolinate synthase family protein [Agrobacterium tumefaciens]